MSEMVERVAHAICRSCIGKREADWLFMTKSQHRVFWLKKARAVLAAMREPTEAMVLKGVGVEESSMRFEPGVQLPLRGWQALETYRAMVDEALR